jgi:hypothetical protein
MNKLNYLLIAVILLSIVSIGYAEEKKLSGTFDVTYMSKLMDKGGEYYGQQGGLLETLDLDLWGSGFGVAVSHREAMASGYVNKERFDYVLHYGSSVFDGEAYKTNLALAWVFHHFPDQARSVGNYYEYVLSASWDELLPWDLVPSYTMAYETPAGSGYGNKSSAGFWHNFGLSYALNTEELPNAVKLSVDAAYRDGLGGGAVDHDWTHVTFGASTSFDITESVSFVPGLYHQVSMDDSVTKRDVTYASISMKFKF